MRSTKLFFTTVLVASSGCYEGLTVHADGLGDGLSDGDVESTGDHEDDPGGDGPGADDPAAQCGPTHAPLRRLTETQYVDTVASIFAAVDRDALTSIVFDDVANAGIGFDNAAQRQIPAPALIESYQRAAVEVTTSAFSDIAAVETFPGHELPSDAAGRSATARATIADKGRLLFRRPLSDAEVERYFDFFEAAFAGGTEEDFLLALSTTMQSMLQSPNFIYIVENGDPDSDSAEGEWLSLTDHEVATRLAILFWNQGPDEELLDLADSGGLGTTEEIEVQARRMLEDERAHGAMRDFHAQWLELDAIEKKIVESPPDPEAFPDWHPAQFEAAREQMERFVDSVMVDGDATLRSLLTSTRYPVNPDSGELLGLDLHEPGWQTVEANPDERRGLLTLPGFLGAHTHAEISSPVQRGLFVATRLLCMTFDDPGDVDMTIPVPAAGTQETTRSEIARKTQTPGTSCAGCHDFINPPGYLLEHYDSVGAFRVEDNGLGVDASAEIGAEAYADILDYAEALPENPQFVACVSDQWFRYGFGLLPSRDKGAADYDENAECVADALAEPLAASGGDIREFLVAIATTHSFSHIKNPG